jgi:hypothetical protein
MPRGSIAGNGDDLPGSAVLQDADPALKAEVYPDLGLCPTYRPAEKLVSGERQAGEEPDRGRARVPGAGQGLPTSPRCLFRDARRLVVGPTRDRRVGLEPREF